MPGLLLLLLVMAAEPDIGGEASREVARQNCEPVDKDEILVCGNRRRGEKYRMPGHDGPFDPAGSTPSVMRERMSWVEEGDTGTQSCGAVGPGGWTGCMVQAWKREREQTQWGKNAPRRW
jgi:hypothetical protein